jgi:LysM repeat protein
MLARLHQLAPSSAGTPAAAPHLPGAYPAPVAIPATPPPVGQVPTTGTPAVSVPGATDLVDHLKSAYQDLMKRLADLTKRLFTPAPATEAPPTTPAPTPPAPATPATPATYVVQSGDSLSVIAKRTLGDGNRWREIYDLNRDVLGTNPNLIHAGQTLRLPGGAATPPPTQSMPKATPSGKWEWPVAGRKTSNYGMRKHPISGAHRMHTGMDIGASSGTPVKTPQAGKVSFAGWNGGYGNYVVVDHGSGLQTAYAHLSKIDVAKGQSVAAGTVVGKVGSTGDSTGPHLHFEVKQNGQFVNPTTMLA